MHLAAMADVYQVVEQPGRTDAVNVRGTFNLLEAARAEGVSRFVYASTIWVYGNAPGPEPHDEDTALVLPPHLYTATKLAGEMYCRSFETLYGVSTTISASGSRTGPAPALLRSCRRSSPRRSRGTPLTIAGDGGATRQFVYVEDLAEGVVAGARARGRGPRLQPGRRGARQRARDRRDGPGDRRRRADRARAGPPADLEFGRASGERAAAELGWRPKTSFPDGVRRYVDWLAVTNGSPVAGAASSTAGSAATV